MFVTEATDPVAIARCFPTMQALRPHFSEESAFVVQVQAQRELGYRLFYIGDHPTVPAVIGFRIGLYLAWGKILYIDDLSTLPDERGKGYGSALLAFVNEHARNEHCAQVHLDTGHHRHDAHRLYLQKGFHITSHHMARDCN